MTRASTPQSVTIDLREVEAMLARAALCMSAEDCALIRSVLDSLVQMAALAHERGASIARMRRLFKLSGSEKLCAILPADGAASGAPEGPSADAPHEPVAGPPPGTAPAEPTQPPVAPPPPASKPKGHGRVPASAYRTASHEVVAHQTLHAGDRCPACNAGTLYRFAGTAPVVRIFGVAPLVARRWDPESLRCSGCGHVHTARLPVEARGPKYDETASSMMALYRYGAGMPFNRLDRLQHNLQTPVPSSTQWDLLAVRVELVRPAYNEMERLAAQGEVLHNDDTYVRILALMGKRRAALLAAGKLPDPERTGLFTTAIVSIVVGVGAIALFFTGRRHAGENLDRLLALRDPQLGPPIQMGDASSRNVPEHHPVQPSTCIVHGRRLVADEKDNHPDLCRHLIEQLALVFKTDKECRDGHLSADERLRVHQEKSGPIMEHLRAWMTRLLADKRVEPNSGLGKAFTYFLKRWEKFTLFLRVPGAPLENNIAERALKKAIHQRNASLFYRSARGASVGDVWTTLIYTAELHNENPFEYLTALQRHARHVAEKPADWMPWNFRQALDRLDPHFAAVA